MTQDWDWRQRPAYDVAARCGIAAPGVLDDAHLVLHCALPDDDVPPSQLETIPCGVAPGDYKFAVVPFWKIMREYRLPYAHIRKRRWRKKP